MARARGVAVAGQVAACAWGLALLGAAATALDGARSLLTGLAANASIASGRSVDVAALLDLSEWE